MIIATVKIDPSDIEIDNLKIWTEYETVEFWGSVSREPQTFIDWEEITYNGETVELEGESLQQFFDFILETYA